LIPALVSGHIAKELGPELIAFPCIRVMTFVAGLIERI
jgi:hypothetical protein